MKRALIRLWNFLFGWIGLKINELEAANPEVVYMNQIRALTEKRESAVKAASALKAQHMRLLKEDAQGDAEREELKALLEVAIENNDDKSATEILEKIEVMEDDNTRIEAEIVQMGKDMASITEQLNEVDEEIAKLKKEKNTMIAQLKSADAKLEVKKALDDLGTSAESESLNSVREAIQSKVAEVQFRSDLDGASHDGRMKELRKQANKKSAADKLAALKAERAAQQSA